MDLSRGKSRNLNKRGCIIMNLSGDRSGDSPVSLYMNPLKDLSQILSEADFDIFYSHYEYHLEKLYDIARMYFPKISYESFVNIVYAGTINNRNLHSIEFKHKRPSIEIDRWMNLTTNLTSNLIMSQKKLRLSQRHKTQHINGSQLQIKY